MRSPRTNQISVRNSTLCYSPTQSIINDPERGAVLQTGAAGLGAATLHDDKLEVSQSYTLSAWIKTSSTGIFEHVIGRAGVGPRIMNHWGLGAVSFVQMIDNINGFPFPDFGDEVVNFGPGGPPGGDGEWHHVLVSWNHDTREFWGYFDGETGISADNGLMTSRQTVVTHEGLPAWLFRLLATLIRAAVGCVTACLTM
jgi:hypothetical protein